jgi:hypothetical protein
VRARHLCVTHACTHTSGSVKRTDTRALRATYARARSTYRAKERDRERGATAYRAYIEGGGGGGAGAEERRGQAGVNARA